ncbi:MAG: hypothetical protein JST29_06450 [Bacteroidetes bacterium]|nr:hypothetical protein [Bacteroidota bacterium]MBS1591036.1 hypothetical protein [Bacteroidota bacterium]
MKNKFAHLGRVLTREEAKLIVGGLYDGGGNKTCSEKSDCGSGQNCSVPINGTSVCYDVPIGTNCSSDSVCGNGQKCVNQPFPCTGQWCQP